MTGYGSAISFVSLCFVVFGAHCTEAFLLEEGMSLLQLIVEEHAPALPSEEYYWSSRGRNLQTSSFAPYAAPHDFSAGPTWVWQNDLKEQVRHSPLIDADFNIYVCTTSRLRKFDADGHILWTWEADPSTIMCAAPALYNGSVYVLPRGVDTGVPTIVPIDMKTGMPKWKRTLNGFAHSRDAEALKVLDGVVYFGAHLQKEKDGSDTVVAASASDGSLLWSYETDEVMWNFSPSMPGDGTMLFSSTCGAVFRLSVEGKLIWKAGPSHPQKNCGPTGGALGPNGIFYVVSADSFTFAYEKDKNNTLAAYNATDGSLVWKRELPYRASQYPSVGKLGPDGPLAVVTGIGDQPLIPMDPLSEYIKLAELGGAMRNYVIAMDAGTGATLWITEDTPYPSVVASGERDRHNARDGPVCWPDAQGIPLITGDGTVYTSSSHHGDLRAVKDSNHDGIISPSEVSTFKTGNCFLNSPSTAPGMLVAAPCWGPMYVFKS